MMIYTQTSFKHKKKKTKSRRKLAETVAYWEWRKKHGTHPSQLVGIGTLHKSNAIPIFSDEDAKDLSKMRR